jgi:hypothetical protein
MVLVHMFALLILIVVDYSRLYGIVVGDRTRRHRDNHKIQQNA